MVVCDPFEVGFRIQHTLLAICPGCCVCGSFTPCVAEKARSPATDPCPLANKLGAVISKATFNMYMLNLM